MTGAEMEALIQRVEQAEAASRDLDWDIALHTGWRVKTVDDVTWWKVPGGAWTNASNYPPFFSGSLDAAVSLVPSGLFPRIYFELVQAILVTRGEDDAPVWVEVERSAICATPALALCAAALRARRALLEQEGQADER